MECVENFIQKNKTWHMSPFLIEVYESGPRTPSRDHVTGLDIASCNFSRMYCKESVRIYLCTGLNVCPL